MHACNNKDTDINYTKVLRKREKRQKKKREQCNAVDYKRKLTYLKITQRKSLWTFNSEGFKREKGMACDYWQNPLVKDLLERPLMSSCSYLISNQQNFLKLEYVVM